MKLIFKLSMNIIRRQSFSLLIFSYNFITNNEDAWPLLIDFLFFEYSLPLEDIFVLLSTQLFLFFWKIPCPFSLSFPFAPLVKSLFSPEAGSPQLDVLAQKRIFDRVVAPNNYGKSPPH